MKYLNTGNLTEGTYNRTTERTCNKTPAIEGTYNRTTEGTSLKEPAIRLLPLKEPTIGTSLREPH